MRAKEIFCLPDDQLLDLLQKGELRAFEEIYDRYSTGLYFLAYNLFRNREVCEELVQDLFVHLWTKRSSLRIITLKPYLYRAIRNRALTAIRSGKAQPDPLVLEALAQRYCPEAAVIEKDINRLLDESLEQLPEKCREIFRLSRKEQLSNKEIALRLNLSRKTVENQINIAIRRLRMSFRDLLLPAGWLIVIQLFL